jgi:hypothetical protein
MYINKQAQLTVKFTMLRSSHVLFTVGAIGSRVASATGNVNVIAYAIVCPWTSVITNDRNFWRGCPGCGRSGMPCCWSCSWPKSRFTSCWFSCWVSCCWARRSRSRSEIRPPANVTYRSYSIPDAYVIILALRFFKRSGTFCISAKRHII